jgi:hypothetical protein
MLVSHDPPRAPLSIATYHGNEYPKNIVQEIHKRKFYLKKIKHFSKS